MALQPLPLGALLHHFRVSILQAPHVPPVYPGCLETDGDDGDNDISSRDALVGGWLGRNPPLQKPIPTKPAWGHTNGRLWSFLFGISCVGAPNRLATCSCEPDVSASPSSQDGLDPWSICAACASAVQISQATPRRPHAQKRCFSPAWIQPSARVWCQWNPPCSQEIWNIPKRLSKILITSHSCK